MCNGPYDHAESHGGVRLRQGTGGFTSVTRSVISKRRREYG